VAIYRFAAAQLGRARWRDWRRRVVGLALLLALVVLASAAGLALLDDRSIPATERAVDGLWNAINLVTTLGDFKNMDAGQRLFMLCVTVLVVVFGAFAIGQLAGILGSDEVLVYRENRHVERHLQNLSGHAVVIGYVGLGRTIADRLQRSGERVVVIDRDEDNAAQASDKGFQVVMGDAGVNDGVMHAARIAHARVLFVTTGDPHRNLTLTLMSHTLNATLDIVVTAENEHWGAMLRRAGATRVVIADHVLAEAMMVPPVTPPAAH